MNYTIRVVQGNIDPALVEANWTDPSTGKTHQNVFGLASVCDFPNDIDAGEEFYFQIKSDPGSHCGVCEAYYPTPPKRLAITVSGSPCEQVK